jgi:hypothetical protein
MSHQHPANFTFLTTELTNNFFFLRYCGFYSGPCAFWVGTLPLEPLHQPKSVIFVLAGSSPWTCGNLILLSVRMGLGKDLLPCIWHM